MNPELRKLEQDKERALRQKYSLVNCSMSDKDRAVLSHFYTIKLIQINESISKLSKQLLLNINTSKN